MNKLICPECSRTIAKNHSQLTCSVCDLTYHIKCGNVTPKDFKLIQRIIPMIWKCSICLDDISFDLNELPFASLSEESFNSMVRTDPLYNESSQCDSDNDHLHEIAQKINTSPKEWWQGILAWLAEQGMNTRHGQERGHQRAFQSKIYATNAARYPVSFF